MDRARALRDRMEARGVKPINSGELIRKIREERAKKDTSGKTK